MRSRMNAEKNKTRHGTRMTRIERIYADFKSK